MEVLEVTELDERFRYHRIEGCVPYNIKYRAENGLLYLQKLWAKDELDAYIQFTTGDYNELNQMMEGANHEHDDPSGHR
jgi:hypothetical protein